MSIDKTCFRHAKKFSSFVQTEHLQASAVVINVETMSSQMLTPIISGQCFAYTCEWIRNLKKNKNYMVDKLDKVASEGQPRSARRIATLCNCRDNAGPGQIGKSSAYIL